MGEREKMKRKKRKKERNEWKEGKYMISGKGINPRL
jgi:hypothetical protein